MNTPESKATDAVESIRAIGTTIEESTSATDTALLQQTLSEYAEKIDFDETSAESLFNAIKSDASSDEAALEVLQSANVKVNLLVEATGDAVTAAATSTTTSNIPGDSEAVVANLVKAVESKAADVDDAMISIDEAAEKCADCAVQKMLKSNIDAETIRLDTSNGEAIAESLQTANTDEAMQEMQKSNIDAEATPLDTSNDNAVAGNVQIADSNGALQEIQDLKMDTEALSLDISNNEATATSMQMVDSNGVVEKMQEPYINAETTYLETSNDGAVAWSTQIADSNSVAKVNIAAETPHLDKETLQIADSKSVVEKMQELNIDVDTIYLNTVEDEVTGSMQIANSKNFVEKLKELNIDTETFHLGTSNDEAVAGSAQIAGSNVVESTGDLLASVSEVFNVVGSSANEVGDVITSVECVDCLKQVVQEFTAVAAEAVILTSSFIF